MRTTEKDFEVIGRVQDYCQECPPDQIVPTPSIKVVNKEIRRFPDGRFERICLACEFTTKEKQKQVEQNALQAVEPEIMMA